MAFGTRTRAMLIDSVSVEFAIFKADATRIVDFVFSSIGNDLARGVSVNIMNFGTFSVKKHKGHFVHSGNTQVGNSDTTTEYSKIEDYNVVRFVPSMRLKERVNEKNVPDSISEGEVRGFSEVENAVGRKPGRPKKVLTEEENKIRLLALQMIRDDMDKGVAVTTKSVAEKTGTPVHIVRQWRNDAELSVREVKRRIQNAD